MEVERGGSFVIAIRYSDNATCAMKISWRRRGFFTLELRDLSCCCGELWL